MAKVTLKQRLFSLLTNGSLSETFTLRELKKQWKVSWHKRYGVYRTYGEYENLFMHSFVHDTIRPMQKSRLLRRVSTGVYQVTKTGKKTLASL